MAILIDPPKDWGHRFGPSSHLLSDLAGFEGSCELVAFGYEIGLMPAWLQHQGSAKEHFDLFGPRIEWAIARGALVVDRRRLVVTIREKRHYFRRQFEEVSVVGSFSSGTSGGR